MRCVPHNILQITYIIVIMLKQNYRFDYPVDVQNTIMYHSSYGIIYFGLYSTTTPASRAIATLTTHRTSIHPSLRAHASSFNVQENGAMFILV